ncbi:NifB/NifX family molybdenum-iron cluster-binding protein [Corallincola platygyrae]|uniref:NifB/NifX family molybdenum-iron cluster-binding protein n=1 Tax=Corallincola platygyrae TaxID=1193278 RepID=A0ABW4XGC4_9GAMM
MSSPISETAALRVALAAKSLPQLSMKQWLPVLVEKLGEPITDKKLRQLNPKQLRELFAEFTDGPDRVQLAQVFAIFNSEQVDEMSAPECVASEPLPGPKLIMAVTSNNQEQLDGHFGSCLRVLVYEVNAEGYQLMDVRPVTCDVSGDKRTQYMLDLISDCQILATLSVGGPAAAKITRASIHPIKQAGPVAASELLSKLQNVLAGSPPPWIKRLLSLEEEKVEECMSC